MGVHENKTNLSLSTFAERSTAYDFEFEAKNAIVHEVQTRARVLSL